MFLGLTFEKWHIILGLIIEQDMAIMVKNMQTCLPFMNLITELCRCDGVHSDQVDLLRLPNLPPETFDTLNPTKQEWRLIEEGVP